MTDTERLDWLLEHAFVSLGPDESHLRTREYIDSAMAPHGLESWQWQRREGQASAICKCGFIVKVTAKPFWTGNAYVPDITQAGADARNAVARHVRELLGPAPR
jgi:hypothetical protein